MNLIPKRIKRKIGKWVYNRYYKSSVEFETSVYSGMIYTTDGTYIEILSADDWTEQKRFLAMPDGTFKEMKPPTIAVWVEV